MPRGVPHVPTAISILLSHGAQLRLSSKQRHGQTFPSAICMVCRALKVQRSSDSHLSTLLKACILLQTNYQLYEAPQDCHRTHLTRKNKQCRSSEVVRNLNYLHWLVSVTSTHRQSSFMIANARKVRREASQTS